MNEYFNKEYFNTESNRYRDLNSFFREIFGCRVQKIAINAGFTCPNRDGKLSFEGCIYCGNHGSGPIFDEHPPSITEQIIAGKKALKKKYKAEKFIVYFQAFTNTYAPLEILKRKYDEALSIDDIVGIAIGTRPDCIDNNILDMLEEYANKYHVWIEYGLQSIHDRTLKLINRGHDSSTFFEAVELTRNRGIYICAHVILGLPGESHEDMMKTADKIAASGIDGIKIHLLHVIKGTTLEKIYNSGNIKLLSFEEYVNIVCDFLERLPEKMIIQRVTGEAPPGLLVAPQWALDKNKIINAIKNELEKRNSYQGRILEKLKV